MFIQFMMNELQYKNETVKILYVSSFLKKSALKWIQSRLDNDVINSHSKKRKKIQQIFYHFENFIVKLKKIFVNLKEKAITRRKLFKLKQLNFVITYTSQFQTLIYKLNWNENRFITRFLKELQKNVYRVITFINQSKTLIKTIIIVTRINNRLYQIRINNENSET